MGLAACAGSSQIPTPPPPPRAPEATQEDLSDWRSYARTNPRRLRSRGHGTEWTETYVSRDADGTERRAVMAAYETETSPEPVGLTAMVKMPAGYDPDNGDWYYAVLEPDGKHAHTQGRVPLCMACHARRVTTPAR